MEKKTPFETLESKKMKAGRFTIVQDRVRVNGHEQPYDYLEIREGVSILPIRDGNILLQRQYRYPVRSWQWELPGGFVDPGETPDEAAERELKEETGYSVKKLHSLGAFYTRPSDRRMRRSGFLRQSAVKQEIPTENRERSFRWRR